MRKHVGPPLTRSEVGGSKLGSVEKLIEVALVGDGLQAVASVLGVL